jgi:hypothetical protein
MEGSRNDDSTANASPRKAPIRLVKGKPADIAEE